MSIKILLALSMGAALFFHSEKSIHTEDSLVWEVKKTPVEASLRGLSAVSESVAWASGSGGTWLKTRDGGITWDHGVINALDTVDFRSIHGFDSLRAVAVSAGQPAVIYKTYDGGRSWILKHTESKEAFLDGITFVDEQRGYIFGDPVAGQWMILETHDQGETWNSLPNLPAAVSGEGGFAASSSSFLAVGNQLWLGSGGTQSHLHHSSDGGFTWEKFPSPLIQGEASQGIFALEKLENGVIFCVGGDYLRSELIGGNAGLFDSEGKSWKNILQSPRGYRSGVCYWGRLKWVLAVGPTGTDYSQDNGLTWNAFSDEGFHAIRTSHDGKSVWASGSKGKMGRISF